MANIIYFMAVLLMAAASNAHGGYYNPGYYNSYHGGYSPYHSAPHVLTILEERPLAADPVSTSVPLLVVPQDQIHVVHGDISGVSHTKPLVQVKVQGHMEEAMPAVRVQLRRPILVSSLHSTIAFPARFTVFHNGYNMPISVGAVLAPLPTGTHLAPNHPATVSYVYAIPSGPLHYPSYYHQAPSYLPFYYHPAAGNAVAHHPVTQIKPTQPLYTQAGHVARPQQPSSVSSPKPQDPQVQNRPQTPIVTVLDFPSNLASPPSLFYQPPATDLGNREPPQAVAPAGIVQSTQPQPNLSLFVNSKESPYLQVLREEAQRNRNKAASSQQAAEETQVVFVN